MAREAAAPVLAALREAGFEPAPGGAGVRTLRDTGAVAPPPLTLRMLLMVPHGATPANAKLLFQDHTDGGEDQRLVPDAYPAVEAGAEAFCVEYLPALRSGGGEWVWLRSPLLRAAQTAEVYRAALRRRGFEMPEPTVDPAAVELNHASWHGKAVADLPAGAERDAAAAFRAGDFFAAPGCGAGESAADLLLRAQGWLASLSARYPRRRVVAFGHGMFQNAVEALLRTYPGRSPAEVFTRKKGASHLRRGRAHHVYPPIRPRI